MRKVTVNVFKCIGLFLASVLLGIVALYVVFGIVAVFDEAIDTTRSFLGLDFEWIFFISAALIYFLAVFCPENRLCEKIKISKKLYFLSTSILPLLFFVVFYWAYFSRKNYSLFDKSAEPALICSFMIYILSISLILVICAETIRYFVKKISAKRAEKAQNK